MNHYWIPALLGSVFAMMMVAGVLCTLAQSRRKCFKSDPDALQQCYNDCERCEDREECLK